MVDDEVLDGDAVRARGCSLVKVDVVGLILIKPRPDLSMKSLSTALDELEMVGAGRESSAGLHVIRLQTGDAPLALHGDGRGRDHTLFMVCREMYV